MINCKSGILLNILFQTLLATILFFLKSTLFNTLYSQYLIWSSYVIDCERIYYFRNVADELRIFESIHHPNLINYFGVEIHREEMLIFMEYCPEGTLEVIKYNGVILRFYFLTTAGLVCTGTFCSYFCYFEFDLRVHFYLNLQILGFGYQYRIWFRRISSEKIYQTDITGITDINLKKKMPPP